MASDIQVLTRPAVHNTAYHVAGLVLMLLNQWRHRIRGYRTPRPAAARNPTEALRYDRAVVENWLRHLRDYSLQPEAATPANRNILEIGPGPDLGTGLLLLAAGARSYLALDAHHLLQALPSDFHRQLAEQIASEQNLGATERNRLLESMATIGAESRLGYRVLPNFDLRGIAKQSIDLVLGHSSFEHLSDVDKTMAQLAAIARPGAILVTEIDLQTHTRWLRTHDPLNLYRYGATLFRALAFRGSPNRLRPHEYLDILERHGWVDPRFYPLRVLDPEYVRAVEPSLSRPYRGNLEQLGWMSVVLCATRAEAPSAGSWT